MCSGGILHGGKYTIQMWGQSVGNQDFFHQADQHEFQTVGNRIIVKPFLDFQLREHIESPFDRSGKEFHEKQHVEHEVR